MAASHIEQYRQAVRQGDLERVVVLCLRLGFTKAAAIDKCPHCGAHTSGTWPTNDEAGTRLEAARALNKVAASVVQKDKPQFWRCYQCNDFFVTRAMRPSVVT